MRLQNLWQKTLTRLSNWAHYFGLALVIVLYFQASKSLDATDGAMEKLVQQEEKRRSLIWINLLIQRSTILAISSQLDQNDESLERSLIIADSIETYSPMTFKHQGLNPDETIMAESVLEYQASVRKFAELTPVMRQQTKAYRDLDRVAEQLGQRLNSIESKSWYAQREENLRMVEEFKMAHTKLLGMIILFAVCLAFIGWTTGRRRRAEEALRQSEKNLQAKMLERDTAEQANKAKSVFLANISHELRTPMHGILSFARFGQQKIDTSDKAKLKTYFDEIADSGGRLMYLLNDLLDLSKMEAGKIEYSFKEDDLVPIVRSTITELSAFAEEKELQIELIVAESSYLAHFDGERIMQVVRNLLSNAVKFSHRKTKINVEIHASDSQLFCTVINRGEGIPENELNTIFEKFTQSTATKNGSGGTGLGLAICREIIAKHGGTIKAENSKVGETRFVFEIPISVVAKQSA